MCRKQLIDTPSNTGILTKRATTSSQVEDVHQNIFNFDRDRDDLLTLFSRVILANGGYVKRINHIVRTIWIHHIADPNFSIVSRIDLVVFLEYLGALHANTHQGEEWYLHPLSEWAQCFTKEGFIDHLSEFFARGQSAGCGLDIKNLEGYFDRVVHGGELKVNNQDEKYVVADWFDPFQHRQLCGLLQVPEIPRWAKDLTFCYAVKTQWACGKVFAVLEDRSTFTDLEFAAIKEEIYLTLDADLPYRVR